MIRLPPLHCCRPPRTVHDHSTGVCRRVAQLPPSRVLSAIRPLVDALYRGVSLSVHSVQVKVRRVSLAISCLFVQPVRSGEHRFRYTERAIKTKIFGLFKFVGFFFSFLPSPNATRQVLAASRSALARLVHADAVLACSFLFS